MRFTLTRVVAGLAATVVSAGFLVGTAGPAAAATGCTISYRIYSPVKAGQTRPKARSIECLLHQAGYATTVDGSFTTKEAGLLRSFQEEHGLAATGKATPTTWAALISQGSTPDLRHGDRGKSVRRLQLALRALGRDELTGTKVYNLKTVAAVKALQSAEGLKPTGRTGDQLWGLLQDGGKVLPAAKGASPAKASTSAASAHKTTKSKGQKALAFAKKQLGDRYRYASAGPNSWDCSGLTMKAWAKAGVKLPHSAKGQYHKGKKVKRSDLRPGDLVFFYSGPSHVGIYAGHGKVIHAPRPGKKVSYIKIKYMSYKGARRPG